MVSIPERAEKRKNSSPEIDVHERAVQIIARRFALPLTVATVIVDAAGIGGASR